MATCIDPLTQDRKMLGAKILAGDPETFKPVDNDIESRRISQPDVSKIICKLES